MFIIPFKLSMKFLDKVSLSVLQNPKASKFSENITFLEENPFFGSYAR